MQNRNGPLTPDLWLKKLFACQAAQRGEVIRRKARDIERYAGREAFMAEVHRRGYQVLENSGQIIVICNQAPIKRLTPAPR